MDLDLGLGQLSQDLSFLSHAYALLPGISAVQPSRESVFSSPACNRGILLQHNHDFGYPAFLLLHFKVRTGKARWEQERTNGKKIRRCRKEGEEEILASITA